MCGWMCLHTLYRNMYFNIHSSTHRNICIFLTTVSAKHSSLLSDLADVLQCVLSCGNYLSKLLRNIYLKCFLSRGADVLFFFGHSILCQSFSLSQWHSFCLFRLIDEYWKIIIISPSHLTEYTLRPSGKIPPPPAPTSITVMSCKINL
jgi:hypothetical protein